MAELTISADEIRAALDDYVSSYSPEVSREEVGTVAETGDGIARVEGLPSAMTNELLRFEDGTLGLAQTLDVREIGVVILGEQQGIDEGQTVYRTGEILSVPVGDGFLGRVINPLGQPIDGLGRDPGGGPPAAGAAGAERGAAAAGEGAAADRHQGDRRDDRDRPGPAPAHHRRPADRQDDDRDRHDPQPEGQLGHRRPEAAGALHLRRDRAEGLHDRRAARDARGAGRDRLHDDRRRPGLGRLRLQVPGSVHRLGHRPALDVQPASTC